MNLGVERAVALYGAVVPQSNSVMHLFVFMNSVISCGVETHCALSVVAMSLQRVPRVHLLLTF